MSRISAGQKSPGATDSGLRLRIRLVNPPADVAIQMQRGARELLAPAQATASEIVFEFTVRVGRQPNGEPNFLGPIVQGPPARRFVYVTFGTFAGQADSVWSRRAKIALTDINWTLLERAQKTAGVLEFVFPGTGKDGGPTCGTVTRHSGWRIAP